MSDEESEKVKEKLKRMNHETHEMHEKTEGIKYKDESYAIQGAIFEVYKEMGCGFLEAVYQECLEKEFTVRRIPFVAQKEIRIKYKSFELCHSYMADFLCYGKIIVEIKAAKDLADEHVAQLFNYLKGTNLALGLLVNFGHYTKAQIKRIVI